MMSKAPARIVLVLSTALLGAVAVAWLANAGNDPRVDLAGKTVKAAGAGTEPRSKSAGAPATTWTGPTPNKIWPTPTPDPTPTPNQPPGSARPQVDSSTERAVSRAGFPVRIEVPSLAIDAPVVAVGQEPDGSMEIPGEFEAGWYHYGPRPGDGEGSSVIAGHVDHAKAPGVFFELRNLEIGQEVRVTDTTGVMRRFRVTERFQVDKDELPSEELFRSIGPPTLTLITCGGGFSKKARTYSDNIVIRAAPVTDPVPLVESPRERATAGVISASA